MKSMKKQYGKKKGEQVFYASKNKGKIKNNQQFVSVFALIKYLALIGIPTIGATLLISNQITIGQFLFASIISMKSVISFELIGQQINFFHQLKDSYYSINTYFDSIHSVIAGQTHSNTLNTITVLKDSEFKNDQDIHFNKNNTFGIVTNNQNDGPNFINLISAKHKNNNKVLWDKLNPDQYHCDSLKQLIGYCDSQHKLFHSSIAEIICPKNIDQYRAQQCLELMGLSEQVRQFTDGINHIIVESDNIDPDFIQRLFIIKAIYHDPELIIFNRVDLFLNQQGIKKFIELITLLKTKNKHLFILSDRRSVIAQTNNIVLIKDSVIQFVGKNIKGNTDVSE